VASRSLRRFAVFCAAMFLFLPANLDAAYPAPWNYPVASSRTLHIGGATIQVDFGPGSTDLPPDRIVEWVERSARSVTVYYGKFPVPRDRVLVEFSSGSGVGHGTTWGGVGGFPAFTRVRVGEHTTQAELDDDWMMTHELIHTGFPSMEDEHHWIEEGIAVYVEPIARVQNGLLRPEKIWSDMVRDMPKGDPGPFDGGLDRTHSWGRTYWGGAQFCLLADVTIRKQTHNRKGLQDALRGIVAAGGTIDQDWPIERAFSVGDQATGTHVLTELYHQMASASKPVDLDGLWKQLGIEPTAAGVRFDDKAPLAEVRKAITRPTQVASAKKPGDETPGR
jgi:hypothetical protein